MRLLSIDPGSSHFGYGILDVSINDPPNVVFADTIHPRASQRSLDVRLYGPRASRIRIIQRKLKYVLEVFQPDAVCIEDCYMGGNASAYRALVEVTMMINDTVRGYNPSIKTDIVGAMVAKAYMGASKKSKDKNLMRKGLLSDRISYSTQIDLRVLDEHAVDAVCIGLAHASTVT